MPALTQILRGYVIVQCLLGLIAICPAQQQCAQRYENAKAFFDSGDRPNCIRVIDSTLSKASGLIDCRRDRALMCRVILLRSIAEAGEDSLEDMRSSLEQIFRTDRSFEIRPYDPLIHGKSGQADLTRAWEQQAIPLRKDFGRCRIGIQISAGWAFPRFEMDRRSKIDTLSIDYATRSRFGWGLLLEYDIIPNLALRANIAYSTTGYRAATGYSEYFDRGFFPWTLSDNADTYYKEKISQRSYSIGLMKSFWRRRKSMVPFFGISVGTSSVVRAVARITDDGPNSWGPESSIALDRLDERASQSFWSEWSVGTSAKQGSTVIGIEMCYRHANTPITKSNAQGTYNPIFAEYGYWENRIYLNEFTIRLNVRYILSYHKRNRFFR